MIDAMKNREKLRISLRYVVSNSKKNFAYSTPGKAMKKKPDQYLFMVKEFHILCQIFNGLKNIVDKRIKEAPINIGKYRENKFVFTQWVSTPISTAKSAEIAKDIRKNNKGIARYGIRNKSWWIFDLVFFILAIGRFGQEYIVLT